MKKLLTLTLILLLLAGCHNKKSAEELFNETASGVVVVLNEFYYEIQLPNGESLYFKGLDANGDLTGLTPEAEEAKKNRNIITGTAFFIDKEGTLMTNRHVAQPNIDAVTARRSLIRLIKTLELLYSEKMAELSQQYDLLENQKSQCTYYDYDGFIHTDEARLVEINEQQERLGQQYAALEKSKDGLNANIDPEGIRIRIISELGIAYNNTYITSENDFIVKNPCVVVRTSDKEDIDLALIS